MSYNYTGITANAIGLLSLNAFNDSKPFYEEHKEELKQNIVIPMRQIVLDLSDLMCEIDPLTDANPVYSVSRIRRDTRRTKNKQLYRDNLWLFMRRNKFSYPFAPFYWFEFTPQTYAFGLGMWTERQTQFDAVREKILAEPDRWFSALDATKSAGLTYNVRDYYKKDKIPNAPEKLKPYLNAKNAEFFYISTDLGRLADTSLIDELRLMLDISSPMYKFLIEAYDKAFSEGMINADYYRR